MQLTGLNAKRGRSLCRRLWTDHVLCPGWNLTPSTLTLATAICGYWIPAVNSWWPHHRRRSRKTWRRGYRVWSESLLSSFARRLLHWAPWRSLSDRWTNKSWSPQSPCIRSMGNWVSQKRRFRCTRSFNWVAILKWNWSRWCWLHRYRRSREFWGSLSSCNSISIQLRRTFSWKRSRLSTFPQ